MVTKPQRQDSSRARKDKLLSCPYPRSLQEGEEGLGDNLSFLNWAAVGAGDMEVIFLLSGLAINFQNVVPYFMPLCLSSESRPFLISLGLAQLSSGLTLYLLTPPSRTPPARPWLPEANPLSIPPFVWCREAQKR